MYAQLAVDHGVFVIAHAAGAHRMENRGTDPCSGLVQLFFSLQGFAGQVFHRFELAQGRSGDDAPGQANSVGGHAQVFGVAEVIRLYQRRIRRVGRTDIHPAATLGAQVADRRGKCREAVQRFAKAFQGQWLHMVLQVGGGLLRAGAGKRAKLAGRHRQRAAAVVQVAQAHAHLAPQCAGDLVQGAGIFQLVDQAQLQVILQVAANAWQLVHHVDTQRLEHMGRADP